MSSIPEIVHVIGANDLLVVFFFFFETDLLVVK